ncbi:MAG: sn-glycerol-3-phosphate ABC transporter ATP-binding protein UgpC [Nitrospirota bacterium]
MSGLRVESLSKSFGDLAVIERMSFEVADGEFAILLGPSGCGKSTVLKLIAGLEHEDEGDIFIGERRVNDLSPRERDVAMVFQNYALYPHMNVLQNMAFPLTMRKTPREVREQKVREAARLLGIEEMLQKKPLELSGGQRQRVAMGRAIVRDPRLFLFDEPLSNLDAQLRAAMRLELIKLHEKLRTTTVYVTHDQVEAMTLGQKIILLDKGKIQQTGSPMEVYERPANVFAATFIGSPAINLLEGKLEVKEGRARFRGEAFSAPLAPFEAMEEYDGRVVTLGVRPEAVVPQEGGALKGRIDVLERLGAETVLYVALGEGLRLTVRMESRFEGKAGQEMALAFDPRRAHLFYEGRRIN